MKALLVLALLVVAASAVPKPDKRFLEGVDSPDNTFNQAKDSFDSLTKGLNVDFDTVVSTLIPLIDSDMSQIACTVTCVGASASVLGAAAPLSALVCAPVCKAALSQLKQAAGK